MDHEKFVAAYAEVYGPQSTFLPTEAELTSKVKLVPESCEPFLAQETEEPSDQVLDPKYSST